MHHQNCLQNNLTSLVVSAHGQQAYRYMSCVPCPQQTTHHLTSLTSTGGTASPRPVWVPSPSTSRLCTPDLANQRFKVTCYLVRDVKFICATSTFFTACTFPICVPCPQQTVRYLTSLTQLYYINIFHSTCMSYWYSMPPNRPCTTWPQHLDVLCSVPPTDCVLPDLSTYRLCTTWPRWPSCTNRPNRSCTTWPQCIRVLSVFCAPNRLWTTWPHWPSCANRPNRPCTTWPQHIHVLSVFFAPNRPCTTWPHWPSCATSTRTWHTPPGWTSFHASGRSCRRRTSRPWARTWRPSSAAAVTPCRRTASPAPSTPSWRGRRSAFPPSPSDTLCWRWVSRCGCRRCFWWVIRDGCRRCVWWVIHDGCWHCSGAIRDGCRPCSGGSSVTGVGIAQVGHLWWM